MNHEWRSKETVNKSPTHNTGKVHELFSIKVDGDVSVASLVLSYQKEGRYWFLRVVGVPAFIGSVQLYQPRHRMKHQAEENANQIARHHSDLVAVATALRAIKKKGGCTWE